MIDSRKRSITKARYYIDDHAVRFEKGGENSWGNVLAFIGEKEGWDK